jgi:predicted XRE-type DNA-binding protein
MSEYNAWKHMKARCRTATNDRYGTYGARGITYDPAWESFEAFLADVGPRPSPVHSLDRKDNDKGYYKSNVRWATDDEQNQNRTITKLTPRLAHQIRWLAEMGYTQTAIARMYAVQQSNVSQIVNNKRWRI